MTSPVAGSVQTICVAGRALEDPFTVLSGGLRVSVASAIPLSMTLGYKLQDLMRFLTRGCLGWSSPGPRTRIVGVMIIKALATLINTLKIANAASNAAALRRRSLPI